MNVNGSGLRNLTNAPASWDFDPKWSPDGTQIAFERTPISPIENIEIYIMNADGMELRNLTNTLSADDLDPQWSPDGSRIAFESDQYVSGYDRIYIVNANGSGLRELTNRLEDDEYEPRWSPDGSRIAYTRYGGREKGEIYVMNADGAGQPINLTNNPAYDVGARWCPVCP